MTNRATAQTSGAPERTDSLAGRVVTDDGRGLAYARVYVSGIGDATSFQRATVTNESGDFRVDDLAVGAYRIIVSAPGYALVDEAARRATSFHRTGEPATFIMQRGGVITGTVTNQTGEPAIALPVRAVRVRASDDEETSSIAGTGAFYFSQTDDRGVYRIYSLPPGRYLVFAGGSAGFRFSGNQYEGETATYHPSAARETASEITVSAGTEASGTDIRLRGERGHSVSGSVAGGDISATQPVSVTLRHAASDFVTATAFITEREAGGGRFTLDSVADGEYVISARSASIENQNAQSLASAPQRVTVRGADVSGVRLALAPLASIRGRVQLEELTDRDRTECDGEGAARERPPRLTLEQIIVTARRARDEGNAGTPSPSSISSDAADTSGAFALLNLEAGRYRLRVQLPANERWYVRSISTTANALPTSPRRTAGAQSSPASLTPRDEINLSAGARADNVTVIIADGAASVRGQVRPATEGARLPANLRVHLVPVETERADDALRYAETIVSSDGSFQLTRLAPGRYRIFARAISESRARERTSEQRTDAALRAQLRREAETTNTIIELRLCERVADYTLRYAAPTSAR